MMMLLNIIIKYFDSHQCYIIKEKKKEKKMEKNIRFSTYIQIRLMKNKKFESKLN